VLLEQVRPHDHADVGQRQEELVILVDRHQRRRDVAVITPTSMIWRGST